MYNYQLLKQQLEQLITSDTVPLTDSEAKEVIEFIRVNEFGLAYETLCDIIFEEHKMISEEAFNLIKKIGTQMGLDEQSWLKLRSSVT